jgi:hypothetical protein
MTDALDKEIEATARHLVALDAEPGWREQVAHRIAELKREPWWPQLKAKINELRASSPSTPDLSKPDGASTSPGGSAEAA